MLPISDGFMDGPAMPNHMRRRGGFSWISSFCAGCLTFKKRPTLCQIGQKFCSNIAPSGKPDECGKHIICILFQLSTPSLYSKQKSFIKRTFFPNYNWFYVPSQTACFHLPVQDIKQKKPQSQDNRFALCRERGQWPHFLWSKATPWQQVRVSQGLVFKTLVGSLSHLPLINISSLICCGQLKRTRYTRKPSHTMLPSFQHNI